MEDKVVDSRLAKDGRSIRRRRECVSCSARFTTYEEIERAELRVLKRNGSSEPFDKRKVLAGMSKSCEKRPVSMQQLEQAVEDILQEFETTGLREVPTSTIGAKAMEHLHALDDVAYVRYASVYRHFSDLGEFINEIRAMEKRTKPSELQPELFR